MTTPRPLQQLARANREIEIDQRTKEFAHVARWLMLGKGNLGNTIYEAKAAHQNERVLEGIKAAAAGGTTSNATWAAPLAYAEMADSFLASLRNVGVYDAALPFSKQIPLNTQIAVTTVGATAASTGEGQSKIISKLTLAATTLNIRKAVAILVASQELLRASGVASRLFSDELQRAIAAETDSQFLSVLTNGISPTSSNGSNAVAIAQDMAALFNALSLEQPKQSVHCGGTE
jgi:HK97 family phage major capsid protein